MSYVCQRPFPYAPAMTEPVVQPNPYDFYEDDDDIVQDVDDEDEG